MSEELRKTLMAVIEKAREDATLWRLMPDEAVADFFAREIAALSASTEVLRKAMDQALWKLRPFIYEHSYVNDAAYLLFYALYPELQDERIDGPSHPAPAEAGLRAKAAALLKNSKLLDGNDYHVVVRIGVKEWDAFEKKLSETT